MCRHALRSSLVCLFLLGLALSGSARAQGVSTGETLTASTSSSDPLEGRFGGTRTGFEKTYGKPSKTEAGEYPRGDDYRIDGFKRVSAFYHANRIIHLTLTAPTSEFWTTKQADDAVSGFLPTDAKLGKPAETSDGEPLVRAKSEALAKSVDQDTYDEYEASGKPGDLSVTYQLDKRKRVKAIGVELGRVASSTQDAAAAEQTYLTALRQQFDTLAASMDEFDLTLQGLSSGTLDAQSAGQALLSSWNTWRQADADAKGLKPPAGLQETHDLYLKLTELLASAADDYQNGIANGDSALLEAGDSKYVQARLRRILVESTLAAAGAD
ncbi:MAG: hypothetical protein QOF01_4202 [Thermomicrobiales bacterium]|jgi:hypothetical protein|nr:hypothetical protein [Thermomicrobiales bacterium]